MKLDTHITKTNDTLKINTAWFNLLDICMILNIQSVVQLCDKEKQQLFFIQGDKIS